MTGRERFLTAIHNQKPDRLPCQVHSWMEFTLRHVLHGMDQFQAYEYFHMDPVIYTGPLYQYDEKALAKWEVRYEERPKDADGVTHWKKRFITPKGELTEEGAFNEYTPWITKHLIENERDFELWNEFVPVPTGADWSLVREAKKRIGDTGIVRGTLYDFGQGSPWQSFSSILYGTEKAIFAAIDDPDWVHYAFGCMLKKKLRAIEVGGKIELDLVETGGGAGSNTVISPAMHREFCLPYDKIQHEAIHAQGAKIVYHLCGGVMQMLEIVAENGADGLETMTPPEMGGDCNLAEATRRVGNKLFFIGGFNQNAGFVNGTPEQARAQVRELFAACPDGGYICSPSDHFFEAKPENIFAFADEAAKCVYR